jgi:hypothetical protein
MGFVDLQHAMWRTSDGCRSMRRRYSPDSTPFDGRARRSSDERDVDGPVVVYAPARPPQLKQR